MMRTGRLTFLNIDVDIRDGIPWFRADVPDLWLYDLHDFGYARLLAMGNIRDREDEDARRIESWMDDWITKNPPGAMPAWNPFVVAGRLINWCCVLSEFPELSAKYLGSMLRQCEWLRRNIEHDVQANHLLRDATGLLVAGQFLGPDSEVGRRALQTGLTLALRQLQKQILPDGGHYERSLMYHCQVLEDILMALACLRETPGRLTAAWATMSSFLAATLHPDGQIPLFGDAVLNRGTAPRVLFDVHHELLGVEPSAPTDTTYALPHSGYYVMKSPRSSAHLILKAGAPGPPYQLAHSHCDMLSYELSVGGSRVIVDSGTFDYDVGPWRSYCRSTRAHNTVQAADLEQMECWAAFRVGRRYRPSVPCWKKLEGSWLFTGGHDGFAPYRHDRTVVFLEERFWVFRDTVWGPGTFPATSYVHFHPAVHVEQAGSRWFGHVAGACVTIVPWGADRVDCVCGRLDPHQGWYCPEFGVREPSNVLEIMKNARSRAGFGYAVFPYREESVSADELESLANGIGFAEP